MEETKLRPLNSAEDPLSQFLPKIILIFRFARNVSQLQATELPPAAYHAAPRRLVVRGGASRLAYHSIDTLKDSEHTATGRCRINLTFCKAL